MTNSSSSNATTPANSTGTTQAVSNANQAQAAATAAVNQIDLTPATVKPIDKKVRVTKGHVRRRCEPGNRQDLLALCSPPQLPAAWLKLNNIPEAVTRKLEAAYDNITESLNKIPGYVSPSALLKRPDMMLKLNATQFTANVNGTEITITTDQPGKPQGVANALARLNESVTSGPIEKPIDQVAATVASIIGQPTQPRDSAANAFGSRGLGSEGFGLNHKVGEGGGNRHTDDE